MNVVIKRRVAAHNVDAMNRTVKADVDIENGSIMVLDSRSTVDGEDEVWVASKPTASSLGVWMAKSSEVVITSVAIDGADTLDFKGVIDDPRAFTNKAGLVFDAFKPAVGDLIEMTLGDAEKNYLIAGTDYALETATAAGDGFAMKKVGTSILHIGSAKLVKTPVKTYIYEVAAN